MNAEPLKVYHLVITEIAVDESTLKVDPHGQPVVDLKLGATNTVILTLPRDIGELAQNRFEELRGY